MHTTLFYITYCVLNNTNIIIPVVDAPVQQIEIEERQDSPLVKSIKEAQARVQSVQSIYKETIISDNDRSEAKRELLDACNILDQCLLMAKTGGISVSNRAPDALPSRNSAGLTSLRTI